MKIRFRLLPACAVLSLALSPALAQTVWRCGAEGRIYTDAPCSDGRALAIADTRPADDVAAAQALARREQALADTLHRQRLQREHVPAGAGLAGIRHPTPQDIKAKAAARAKPEKARPRPGLHTADGGTWPSAPRVSRQRQG